MLTAQGRNSFFFNFLNNRKQPAKTLPTTVKRSHLFTMAAGKVRQGKSLAEQIADLDDPTPKGWLYFPYFSFQWVSS